MYKKRITINIYQKLIRKLKQPVDVFCMDEMAPQGNALAYK